MPAAAFSDKEYDLNANTGHLDDSERTVTALGDVDDSEKEKTNTGRKSREVIFWLFWKSIIFGAALSLNVNTLWRLTSSHTLAGLLTIGLIYYRLNTTFNKIY